MSRETGGMYTLTLMTIMAAQERRDASYVRGIL